VVLVDSLEFDAPKTKKLVEMLGTLGAEGKVLVLTDGVNENVYLSSRNLSGVIVRPFGEESAYDILWASLLVIEKAALESAEPSDSDKAAMESRSHDEPAVRVRERAAEEEQAERRKARPGHGTKSRKVTEVKAGAEIDPERKVTLESKPKAKAKPKDKAKAKTESKTESEAPQKTEAKAEPETESEAPQETKAEAEAKPKAEAKPEAEPKTKAKPKQASPKSSAASGSELDLSTVKLPKVGDMAEFLAQFDNESDIEALKARDSRKTAQPHYEARLVELSGSAKGKKG